MTSTPANVNRSGDQRTPLAVGGSASAVVELRNRSAFPARIVGVARSCRCFDFREDPVSLVLPAHARITRALVIRPRRSGPIHQRIDLFLDHPEQFRLAVHLVGSVSGESR